MHRKSSPRSEIIYSYDFKEFVKQLNMPHSGDSGHQCQLRHESINMLAMSVKNYQQIKSQAYSIFEKHVPEIALRLLKDKILVKRRVLNDYINIVNRRGQIIAKIGTDYDFIVQERDTNLFYFHKYYNTQYLAELENLFKQLGPQFRFGLSSFIKSAENIRLKVRKAGEVIEKREAAEIERLRQLEQEKKRRLREKREKNKFWYLEEQKVADTIKDSQKKTTNEERIAQTKGYMINAHSIEEGKADIAKLQQITELQKFGSDRIKLQLFETDMKKLLVQMEEEKKLGEQDKKMKLIRKIFSKQALNSSKKADDITKVQTDQKLSIPANYHQGSSSSSTLLTAASEFKSSQLGDTLNGRMHQQKKDFQAPNLIISSAQEYLTPIIEERAAPNSKGEDEEEDQESSSQSSQGKLKAGIRSSSALLQVSANPTSHISEAQSTDRQPTPLSSKRKSLLEVPLSQLEGDRSNSSREDDGYDSDYVLVEKEQLKQVVLQHILQQDEEEYLNNRLQTENLIKKDYAQTTQTSPRLHTANAQVNSFTANESFNIMTEHQAQIVKSFRRASSTPHTPLTKGSILQQSHPSSAASFALQTESGGRATNTTMNTQASEGQPMQFFSDEKNVSISNTSNQQQRTSTVTSLLSTMVRAGAQSGSVGVATNNPTHRTSIDRNVSPPTDQQSQEEKIGDKKSPSNKSIPSPTVQSPRNTVQAHQKPHQFLHRQSRKATVLLPMPQIRRASSMLPLPMPVGHRQSVLFNSSQQAHSQMSQNISPPHGRLSNSNANLSLDQSKQFPIRRTQILGLNPKLQQFTRQSMIMQQPGFLSTQQVLHAIQGLNLGANKQEGLHGEEDQEDDDSDDSGSSRNTKEELEREEYQRKQIQTFQTRAMNEMWIEKYYRGKLLGMQKDTPPQYTPEQLEELERLRNRKKSHEWENTRSRLNSNYQGARRLIEKSQEEDKIRQQFGSQILSEYQDLQKKCFQFKNLNKKKKRELQKKRKESRKEFNGLKNNMNQFLGQRKIIFWDMDMKKFQQREKRVQMQKQKKRNNQNEKHLTALQEHEEDLKRAESAPHITLAADAVELKETAPQEVAPQQDAIQQSVVKKLIVASKSSSKLIQDIKTQAIQKEKQMRKSIFTLGMHKRNFSLNTEPNKTTESEI